MTWWIALLSQVADAITATIYRLPGMITGAVIAVACHGAAMLAIR